MSDPDLQRLIALLGTTPVGLGLLNSVVVDPVSSAARTDTIGVPNGAVNVYKSGATLVRQIFDFEDGVWRSSVYS